MNKRNKKLVCTVSLAIVMSINTVCNTGMIVYANQNNNSSLEFAVEKNIKNINIISDTDITVQDAKKWAKNNGATETFVNLADLYWKHSKSNGNVNPALAYVQAAHETGFGRFGGVLDESYYNPCGMKNTNAGINDDTIKEAHKRFDSWEHGVLAHLDHLALYAGSNGYPKKNIEQSYVEEGLDKQSTYDPRHFAYLAGSAKTALDLSGSWAAGNYGEKLIRFYNELIKVNEQNRRGWYHDSNYNWYYYNENGELYRGWLILPEGKYYLGSDGIMKKGWYEESGKKYYFNEYGAAVVGQTIEIDGKEYKFDKDGVLIKNIITGWYHDDNYNWYYYNEDGKLHKGWLILPEGKYYLGLDGIMKKGWYEESGKKYYFNKYGAAVVGQTIEIDGKEYKFDKDGVLIKNIITGWYHDDNYNWYYYNEDGKLHKGWLILPEGKYYLGSDGIMKKGWYEESGKKYYFNEYGAAIVGQTVIISGEEYTFDKNGVLQIRVGWFKDKDKWYYYDENGKIHKGWLNLLEGKFYFDENGEMQTYWKQIQDKWYYFGPDGKQVKGWLKSNDIRYYFKEDGSAAIGWNNIDGNDYYFYEGCNMAQLEFIGNTYVGVNGVAKYPSKGDKYRIVIDPGHYNQGDKGTVQTHDGITYEEGVINMQVAEILKTKLEEQGYEVLLTRTADDYGLKDTLENRVVFANNNNADLFISIHQDSFTDPSANGMTIFYDTYRPNVDNIGVKVDSSGNKYDESPSRAAKLSKDLAIALTKSLPDSLNIRNRGSKYANWYVTRNTIMPSLLIECGFLSNPTEAKKISDKSHQSKMASLLVENINTLFRK